MDRLSRALLVFFIVNLWCVLLPQSLGGINLLNAAAAVLTGVVFVLLGRSYNEK